MKRLLIFLSLLICIAAPAFGRISLERITIYFTGARTLNGRQQLGTSTVLINLGPDGTREATNWRTIHGFEDAFTATAAATTGVVLTAGSATYSNTFTMWGNFSTCYRARVEAKVSDGDLNAYGSSQLCTASAPIINPPCEYRPEGCDGGVPVNCPLIVNLAQGPWHLSGLDDAVLFDIDGDGVRDRMGWTGRGSNLAFVARDRNGNSVIDNVHELFGDATPLASGAAAGNGFQALEELDVNADGAVDRMDPAWQTLSLWTDANPDGVSQAGELQLITDSQLEGLSTRYHYTGRADQSGNEFRLKSQAFTRNGSKPYYDIFFRVDR